MQKKLIALAIAGLSSAAAFAQSNVTVYGVVDASQSIVKAEGGSDFAATSFVGPVKAVDAKSVTRLDTNSSYVGFKGVEDLGNGLKALFQFETGFNADTGVWNGSGRDTYVGLTGGFGTLIMGNITHPLRAMGTKTDIVPGYAGFGTSSSLTGTVIGLKTGADDRASHAVAYVSPNFSGFTATVAYLNGERRTNTVNNPGANEENARAWQVAGQYENGPLWLAAGYHRTEDSRTLGTNLFAGADDNDTAKVWRIAGAYTFPTDTKVAFLYDSTKYETDYGHGFTPNDQIKRNAWMINATQRFNRHLIGAQYTKANDLSGSTCGNLPVGLSCSDTGAKMWTLLYTYDLSKRTMLHARWSKLTQDQSALMNVLGANHNFYNNPISGTPGTGADPQGWSVGLRHSF